MKDTALTAVRDAEDDTYPARLEAASDSVNDLRAALEAAIELRDRLIVEAIEHGYTNRDTARHAKLSEGRVVAILARW